jgi:hypothetical protein
MPKKFFNLDLHISVIADVKNILHQLYGKDIEVTNWSISGHNWVFKQNTPTVQVINAHTWRGINIDMINKFHQVYDHILKEYDGFIVTHTPIFALLYEKYGKPIIMVNSCRYEQPFSWTGDINMWGYLNVALKRMWDNKQLIAISNNRPDADYLFTGTGVKSHYIPSLCEYTNAKYNPITNKCIVYGNRNLFPESNKLVARPHSGYEWKDLYSYKAIVHIPYEMSTMSIFEQVSAGIPLFFPSKRFYLECNDNGLMTLSSRYANSVVPIELKDFYDTLDKWINGADFYAKGHEFSLKYIYYYDSFNELVANINKFNETDEIRQARIEWLAKRKNRILELWKSLMDPIIYSESN